jgi:hypothetical protein
MIASRPLTHSICIENNLEFSSRHPLPQKTRVIFRFCAAVEATNRIVLSIATKLGTTSRTIRRHETGERQIRFSLPQIKRLIELMQRAGMSADDLPDDIE